MITLKKVDNQDVIKGKDIAVHLNLTETGRDIHVNLTKVLVLADNSTEDVPMGISFNSHKEESHDELFKTRQEKAMKVAEDIEKIIVEYLKSEF